MSGLKDIRFIKASAGSGKTYSITQEIAGEIRRRQCGAEQILATTFTVKAANELASRIRSRLLEEDLSGEAPKVRDALIGTINSVCGRLLAEQAIAAGESPSMTVLSDENVDLIFNQSIADVLEEHSTQVNELADRLSISDWASVVRRIIDCARINGIDEHGLQISRHYSIEQARKIYVGGADIALETYRTILNTHREAIAAFVNAGEAAAREAQSVTIWKWCRGLLHNDVRTWRDVKALRGAKWPTRPNGQRYCESLRPVYDQLAGCDMLKSNGLQGDVVMFIGILFSVADKAMSAYARYKKEYGLVDFVDQEIKILELLNESEEFKANLRNRVKAIYVDEFQDTSPVQLAVYLKLAETIAGKTTWVGDSKQAIYRFRGADSAFMSKIMGALVPANTCTLSYSWRSRRNLVDFANEVFAKVFPDLEERGEVRLGLAAGEDARIGRQGGKIGVWQIQSTNSAEYAACLANRITSGFCKGEWKQYADVAVLLHDNSDCARLAEELQKRGVPTSIGGSKLRDDLVANLALCAYRYVYSHDVVAKAVLDAYRPDVAPTDICDPTVLESYSPLELFEKAVVDWKIDDYARGSASPERELATIEALRQLCREYEGTCKVRGVVATHAGFIEAFMNTAESGASAAGCDCVQIHTYHGSKGLEWKTVILGTLDEKADGSPFGVKGVLQGTADVTNPLAHRTVRYIPAPFGDRRSDECGSFREKGITGFDDMSKEEEVADAEEKRRLMYVGVTRAKGEVVFAPQLKINNRGNVIQAHWLESLTPEIPFIQMLSNRDAEWTIGDRTFQVTMEVVSPRDSVEVVVRRRFTDGGVPCPLFEKRKVAPSSLEGGGTCGTRGRESLLGTCMSLKKGEYSSGLGVCVHSYLAVTVPDMDDRTLAEELITRWGVGDILSVDALVMAGVRLRDWIRQTFDPKTIQTEVPMHFNHPNGQVSEGFIDMLVEKGDGSFVIIDHKVIGDHAVAECVKMYAPQQEIYRNAVQAACGLVSHVYLHMPVQGKVVEVDF